MSDKETYFYSSEGANKESIKTAIEWLLEKTENAAYIAALTNNILLQGYVKEILGDDVVKYLIKNGSVSYGDILITLVTRRKKIFDGGGKPMLVIYPNREYLDELDSISNISSLMVVPWIMDDVSEWVKIRGAIDIRLNYMHQPSSNLNPVVAEALKDITSLVNVHTGVIHPLDKATVVHAFRKLRKAGESYHRLEVKSWLVQNGWRNDYAEEVADIAERIQQGRRVRGGRDPFKRNIVKTWRARAKVVSENVD